MVAKLSDNDIEKIVDAIVTNPKFKDELKLHLDRMDKAIDDIISRRLDWALEDQQKYKLIADILRVDFKKSIRNIKENE